MPPKKLPGDPKPKGRTSAYAFFVKSRREEHKKKGESLSFADFSRKCSEEWKDVTVHERKGFDDKAAEDKRRYDYEMSTYEPPGDQASGRKGRGRRKKKDPNAPKRPLSAFIIFCQFKRPLIKEKTPKASVGDIAKELGKAWKIMTPKQKEPYEDKAKLEKKRYEGEKESYLASIANNDEDDEEDEEEEEEED